MTDSASWGTISDVPGDAPLTDQTIMDTDAAVERGHQKKLKEAEKAESGKKDYKGMYQSVYFICGNVAIPLQDEGSIQKHKRLCPKCISIAESRAEEKEIVRDTRARVRYSLHFLMQSMVDIPRLKAKMADPNISEGEKQYKIQRELDEALGIKKRESKELYRICYKDPNELVRATATEMFEECEKIPYKERLRAYQVY